MLLHVRIVDYALPCSGDDITVVLVARYFVQNVQGIVYHCQLLDTLPTSEYGMSCDVLGHNNAHIMHMSLSIRYFILVVTCDFPDCYDDNNSVFLVVGVGFNCCRFVVGC
eukprot:m.124710 g.124710  ORF g.124710 m.124710 type:complete len:110 (+) comp23428_c1_seq8:2272-2601(+)